MKNIFVKYISFEHLCKTIKNSLWKIPYNIDLIVGIPRSGMVPASIIAQHRNIYLASLDEFCNENFFSTGASGSSTIRNKKIKNVLVIDDTVWTGNSMIQAKNKILEKSLETKYNVQYCVVFLEGAHGSQHVDIILEDIRNDISNTSWSPPMAYTEWNIFHKADFVTENMLFDMDGALCAEPVNDKNDESNINEYIESIKKVKPLIIPSTKIGKIVTYRLEKYRDITEKWLMNNHVRYNKLIMFPAHNNVERAKFDSAEYKAKIYKECNGSFLFYESHDNQAKRICQLSGKPAYSVENNCVYNNIYDSIVVST